MHCSNKNYIVSAGNERLNLENQTDTTEHGPSKSVAASYPIVEPGMDVIRQQLGYAVST